MRPESSFLRTEKPHFLLPAHSLPRAHPTRASLSEKSILHFPAVPFPPEKNPSRFRACPPAGAGGLRRGSGGSAEDSFSSHYDPGAESWGNFYSAVLGRAAGRHVPAWVSVGLCIPSSPPPPRPWPPRGAPWQYQVLCSAGSLRWDISCASLGCDDGIFFFAQKPQVLGLQPFHEAHLQRDPAEHAEWPFAHPSHRIRPIISTYSKL